jgi:DNA-binding transcriptional ArsR family regulator
MVRATLSSPSPDVFQAIQEPTRRRILDMLAEGERSVVRISEPFEMTRPAISQHLKLLKDVGLVGSRRVGRENLYHLQAAPLREVFEWVSFYQRFWTGHLAALGAYLDRESKKESKRVRRRK